jgi:Ser-tRNA(Ala) deacylase AlaX
MHELLYLRDAYLASFQATVVACREKEQSLLAVLH